MATATALTAIQISGARQQRITALVFVTCTAVALIIVGRALDWEYVESLDFRLVWQYRATLLRGYAVTLAFTVGGIGLGVLVGTALAIASQSRLRVLRWAAIAYVEFWRNTPLLVQLIWIHFALPLITGIQTSVEQSGLLGVTLNTGAYHSEIVRAGIEAIPHGQWEAAHALGLPAWVRWTRVVLPQAIRIIVPPTTSLFIGVFKATAILSILRIGELMGETVRIINFTYKPVELYTVAAIVYALTGLVISQLARRVERRFERMTR